MGAPIATNRKAFRNFHLTDKWECGIALSGCEVKSIRAGDINFKDTYARVENGVVYIYNLHINPYKQSGYVTPEPDRRRQLLLHKKEIRKIAAYIDQKGLVLVPTKVYFNRRGIVKLELALGKGKRSFDKREDIKKRTIEKALKRVVRARS